MKLNPTTLFQAAAVTVLAAVVFGCASTGTAPKEPTLREDFLEYRQLVVLGLKQVNSALLALERLEAQARENPRHAYEAYAKAVQQLEVDSVRVRARTAAMRARGDAYFETWEKFFATVPREDVRRLSEVHRTEIRQSFEEIRAASQQARDTFRPLLTDLQKLRAVLEAQPDLGHIDAQKPVFLSAEDKGRIVLQALNRILAEMNSIMALLTPPPDAAKH